MALGVKFTVNNREFKKSVRTLRKKLPDDLKKGMRVGGNTIAGNIRDRLTSSYSSFNSPESKGLLKNINASAPVESAGGIFMGIGNINKLDQATEVMAKSTGKVYHLWQLMELGYGMKGGFRSEPYTIYPVMPTSSQGQHYYDSMGGTRRNNVHHSNPDRRVRPALVFYADGKLVFASKVAHPGAEGRFFFLTASRDWYSQDLDIIKSVLYTTFNSTLKKVNYRSKNA